MRPTAALLLLLLLAGCESANDKAARLWPDVSRDAKAGDVAAAREKAEKVKGWSEYYFKDVLRGVCFPETRFMVEGHVVIGKTPPADVDALVAVMADKDLSAWWERRKPILSALAGKKDLPRVTVKFDSMASDPTRLAIIRGLAMNADGIGFECELKAARSYAKYEFPFEEDKPYRTLPGTILGESIGELAVEVAEDSTSYSSKDGSKTGYLTTGLRVKLTPAFTKPTTWTAPQELKVTIEAPEEVRAGTIGISESTEESAQFNLRVAATQELEKAPALKLAPVK